MTKAEFVESLAHTLNQSKSESERVLEAVVDVLKQALQRGEKIDLRGLGVFKVRESKPRQARNPRTGEALSIPAKKAAIFKPGKELSALLNTTAEKHDPPTPAAGQLV
jgi:nucleoid DNA-binding protein